MELLVEGTWDEYIQGSEFKPFMSTFKRYTPFSIVTSRQVIQTDTVEFARGCDILLGAYLYIDNLDGIVIDWSKVISSIDLLVGEQLVDSIPIEYILDYYPVLMCTQYSRFSYIGDKFLPIPLPMIPLCALQYHTVKIKIRMISQIQIQCHSLDVYLSEDDIAYMRYPMDILIHQLQKRNIASDGTVYLSNPVKYVWSPDVTTSRLIIGGEDIWVQDPSTTLYYTTKYGTNTTIRDLRSYLNIDYTKLLGIPVMNVRTSQIVNGKVFIFSTDSRLVVYDMSKPFNSTDAYTIVTLYPFADITSSCYDGKYIYACGYRKSYIFEIDPNNPTGYKYTTYDFTTIGFVYAVLSDGITIYIIGNVQMTWMKSTDFRYSSVRCILYKNLINFLTGPPSTNINNYLFSYADLTKSVDGTTIIGFYSLVYVDQPFSPSQYTVLSSPWRGQINVSADPSFSTRERLQTIDTSLVSSIGTPYSNYSSNVTIGNYNYLVPSNPQTDFAVTNFGSNVFISSFNLNTNQGYAIGAYDGSKYMYMFPSSMFTTVTRFIAKPIFKMYYSFCLDTSSSEPSGALNFSRTSIRIPNSTSGIIYAVNYNILRIKEGMASILYAS